MSEDYGSDFISVTDEEGNEFEPWSTTAPRICALFRRIWMKMTRITA